ncbi:MAG TPA: hypothetical protein VKV04_00935, partial [Verrucomicrobiae bacterium]|nr:hypothetical protein [Verrucomicrobiae bacterium]
LNGNSYSNGLMIVSGSGVLTDGVAGAIYNGGLSNAATVFVSANTTFNGVITNTASFTYQGAVNNSFVNSGTVALNNDGTVAGTLNNQSGGHVIVTNGTLRVLTAPIQNGTIDITLNNTLSVTPAWANGGLLRFSGGFLTGGNTTNNAAATILGAGTASNLLVNLGTLIASNGTFTVTTAPVQTGTVTVTSGGTLNVVPAWLNSGSVNVQGGTLIGGMITNAGSISGFGTFSPSIINNSGATITASSGGTLTLTAISLQSGLVNILGTLNVSSAWSNGNAGTVTINGGVLTGATFTVDGTVKGNGTISANMVISNTKTVVVNGGHINLTALTTLDGGVINGGPVINYGTISGDGTISAALSNPGYVRATNGLLFLQALTGNQATGTLEASAGGTLQANGITSWLNNGQVILSGGTVIGGDISNNASRIISGFGSVNAGVYNSGQVFANNSSQAMTLNNSFINLAGGVVTASTGNIVVNGAFTNAGTLNMIHSIGTFNGTVVNSGAWITDPTTNVFQNTFTVTSSGFIQSTPGDVYIFTNNATTAGNFINVSTNKAQYNTLNGDFQFANTLGLTQVFATAGHDFGPATTSATNQIEVFNPDPFSLPEYSNNFALGTLEISSYTTVRVDDAFITGGAGTDDNLTAALYLNNLFMGTDSLLLISSNVEVYFITSNNWNLANVQLIGNPTYDPTISGIHQLVVVPEPAIVLLWLSSIVTVYAARRRNARSSRS